MFNTMALLLALMVTALGAVVFTAVYTGIFKTEADMTGLKRAFEVRAGFGDIKRTALSKDPSEIFSKGYQETISSAAAALGADVLIFKNRELMFSSRKFNSFDIEKSLVLSERSPNTETLELDGRPYFFDRMDFKLSNGDNGILLMLASIQSGSSFYKYLAAFTIIFFILISVFLNLWISSVFSKGVITPVSRLRAAAAEISEGHLEHEIVEEGEGEVRELCRTLELMRVKLKESVFLQKKYDDNRKFLISSISHDLKTPVTSIKGYIEGIMDGVAKTPKKMESYLETARSKAILVNAMIDDLLLYSKLDLNQIPFNFERTDIHSYFEYCVLDYKYEFEKANIKLALINELRESIFVLIDKERLKRVVQNILDNARKNIIRDDGEVRIILRETRTSAIVEVKDNGRGIPEKDLQHIFDRFYRVDESRTNTDGSGLGLAIARQIVEGHDGRIWAVSKIGEGTSIIMSFKKHQI